MKDDHLMSQNVVNADLHETIQRRAKEIFRDHQQVIYKSTDRLFAGLMLAQWCAAIFAAIVISPRTWQGAQSQVHLHVWAALLLGGVISAFPILLAVTRPGEAITRHVIAGAQMMMSGLLIHLTGGRIETHFHIFGSLAFLAFYRDWKVLIPAALVTTADHFFRGIFWPESIYGVLTASPWRSLEHVGWVVFEDVFLVGASLRSLREMRSIAWHTAQLETTNEVIEAKVLERTAEVKASEERFRLLMDGVKDYAIIMLDPEGRVVSWNEGAKRVNGYHADEVLGEHFSLFHPEEDRLDGRPHRIIEAAASSGRFEEEGWRVRQDGTRFWANVVFTALHDELEHLRGFSKVTRDITARWEAEEKLRQTNDELEERVEIRTAEMNEANSALQREILEHQNAEAEIRRQNTLLEAQGDAAIEGILVISGEGRILSFNKRFAEMWNIAPEVLEGRDGKAFFHAALSQVVDAQGLRETAMALHRDEKGVGQDEILLENDSIFDYYSTPLKGSDGTYYGRIWFFRDVTEARRAAEALSLAKDEAERANAAKSEFLSRMSHELRTPMNAILGFGQILQWDDLTEDQSRSVDQILKGGRHLLGLINEVLEISRIEAGHTSLSLEPVSLHAVLREAMDMVQPLAAQNRVEMDDAAMGGCAQIVMADQQRLKQVILNLLSNAIKYNRPEGQVSISCVEKEPGRLRVSIRDTGIGIAKKNVNKLFMPFERLGAEYSPIEGNGIGLSLSRQLMTLMGGEIGVDSVMGEGSTFWIELQLGQEAEVHALIDDKVAVGSAVPSQSVRKPSILYIEDNLSNLTLVENILRRHFNIEILSSMQGSLGLQLARQHRPDLILLDLHLPDVMGDKVLAQLMENDETKDIPVIMLSADATERQVQRLLELGAKDYLTKPLDVNRFLEVLEENLKTVEGATVEGATVEGATVEGATVK
jgi:PAS domain S-box-containing protein